MKYLKHVQVPTFVSNAPEYIWLYRHALLQGRAAPAVGSAAGCSSLGSQALAEFPPRRWGDKAPAILAHHRTTTTAIAALWLPNGARVPLGLLPLPSSVPPRRVCPKGTP